MYNYKDDTDWNWVRYTYEELSKRVDDWHESLDDEQRYRFVICPEPTFEMWVLGLIKPGDVVEMNLDNCTYEIVK